VKVRFLLDENLMSWLTLAMLRREPTVDVLRVGDADAPPLGTRDPDILRYVEQAQRLLVTANRASMPAHVAAHRAAGGHHWGVFRLRPAATVAQVAEELLLIWSASDAEEWVDQFDWLPL
jgi:hypothetical protein